MPVGGLRQLNQRERELWTWARLALVAWAVLGVGLVISSIVLGHWFAGVIGWHEFLHDIQTHQPINVNVNSAPGAAPTVWLWVLEAVEGVTGIGFLMWQYKAATVARGLGYYARLTPGWGVGVWFIPIANLFMPYVALRDLLPPGHPARGKALQAWLCYVGLSVCVTATTIAAYFGGAAVVIPAIAAAGCLLGVLVLGHRLLVATRADHDRAVASLGL
jgi:hypothetical protein